MPLVVNELRMTQRKHGIQRRAGRSMLAQHAEHHRASGRSSGALGVGQIALHVLVERRYRRLGPENQIVAVNAGRQITI